MRLSEIESKQLHGEAWNLLFKLARDLDWNLDFKGADFDRDEVAADAVKIAKIQRDDPTAANNIKKQLSDIRQYLKGNGVFTQLNNAGASLPHFGFSPPKWFQAGLDGNAALVQMSGGMADHVTAVEELTDFLLTVMKIKPDGSKWGNNYPFANAVLKKLGIR